MITQRETELAFIGRLMEDCSLADMAFEKLTPDSFSSDDTYVLWLGVEGLLKNGRSLTPKGLVEWLSNENLLGYAGGKKCIERIHEAADETDADTEFLLACIEGKKKYPRRKANEA